jgi:hypothetical protein
MRDRLPCYWWDQGESKKDAKRRRDQADVADQFAAIVRERYARFLPRENMTEQEKHNVVAFDQLFTAQGHVSPLRVLDGAEFVANDLRSIDQLRRVAGLRSNQDDFDMISRTVLCNYVQRSTGDWHDREVAVLLSQVGNYKSNRRRATLDAIGLRKWRGGNQDRLEPLSTWSVDQLVRLAPSIGQSPSSK